MHTIEILNCKRVLKATGALVIALLAFSSCGSAPSSSEYVDKSAGSKIAICGAGLEAGLASKLEAGFVNSSGANSIEFQTFVRSSIFAQQGIDSTSKQVMYDSFLACVLEIDQRERLRKEKVERAKQCTSTCDAKRSTCVLRASSEYDSCLLQTQTKCKKECKRYWGLSPKQCERNCELSKNKDYWTGLECDYEFESSLDDRDECQYEYSECKTTCSSL